MAVVDVGHCVSRESIINNVLAANPDVQAVAMAADKTSADLDYRLSLNVYTTTDDTTTASGENFSGGSSDARASDPSDAQRSAKTLFGYHVDLPSNGDVTAIVTLVSPGCIQFVASPDFLEEQQLGGPSVGTAWPEETSPETIVLPPGSLLVAAGDARWRYMHRVIETYASAQQPGQSSACTTGADAGTNGCDEDVATNKALQDISRLSLVLGCR
jgi:hypothetical protein